jgi:hypothetical protein
MVVLIYLYFILFSAHALNVDFDADLLERKVKKWVVV